MDGRGAAGSVPPACPGSPAGAPSVPATAPSRTRSATSPGRTIVAALKGAVAIGWVGEELCAWAGVAGGRSLPLHWDAAVIADHAGRRAPAHARARSRRTGGGWRRARGGPDLQMSCRGVQTQPRDAGAAPHPWLPPPQGTANAHSAQPARLQGRQSLQQRGGRHTQCA